MSAVKRWSKRRVRLSEKSARQFRIWPHTSRDGKKSSDMTIQAYMKERDVLKSHACVGGALRIARRRPQWR